MPWILLLAASFFYVYEYLLRIFPVAITAQLMQQYQLNAGQLGLLSASYYYAYTPLQLVVGGLMDKYGPKRLLFYACLLCAFGMLVFTGSSSLLLGALGRFLVGFGSAFAFVGVLTIAAVWLPENKFALVSGFLTTLGVTSGMLGTIWLLQLVKIFGWKMTGLYASIVGIALGGLILLAFKPRNKPTNKQSSQHNNISGLKAFLTVAGNKRAWIAGLIGAALYASLTVFAELWGIHFFVVTYDLQEAEAAWLIFCLYLGWAIGSPIQGFISDYYQTRITIIRIGILAALCCVSMLLYYPGLSYTALCCWCFFYGCSSSAQIIVFALGKEQISSKISSTAIAFVNMLIMLSGMLLQPLVGLLVSVDLGFTNLAYAMCILPATLVLAFSISLLIRS